MQGESITVKLWVHESLTDWGVALLKSLLFFSNVLQLELCHYGSEYTMYFIHWEIRKKIKRRASKCSTQCRLLLITEHLFRGNWTNDALHDTTQSGPNLYSTYSLVPITNMFYKHKLKLLYWLSSLSQLQSLWQGVIPGDKPTQNYPSTDVSFCTFQGFTALTIWQNHGKALATYW